MNKILRYSFVALLAMVFGNSYAAWEKATSIAVGDVLLLTVDAGSDHKELTGFTTTGTIYGQVADFTGTPAGTYPLTVEAGSTDGTFAFKNGSNYLCVVNGKNSLSTSESKDALSSWTVTFNEGVPTIMANDGTDNRYIKYNTGSPRFACYKSGQTDVTLWKQVASGSVAAPILPSSTTFLGSIDITITAEDGASIYYTLDGTDPTTSSTPYSTPFTLTETKTVKAIAAKGGNTSSVASATYTLIESIANTPETAYTVADAKNLIDTKSADVLSNEGNKVYVKGYITNIVKVVANGSAQFWISDTKGESKDFEAYNANDLENAKFASAEDQIAVGDEVILYGNITKYGTTYETSNGKAYIYSLNGYTKRSDIPTNISAVKSGADVNAPAYNLAGQKVDKNYKGVVIMNGKKMIQK